MTVNDKATARRIADTSIVKQRYLYTYVTANENALLLKPVHAKLEYVSLECMKVIASKELD